MFSTIISVNKHVSLRISRTPFPPPTLFTQSKEIKRKEKKNRKMFLLFFSMNNKFLKKDMKQKVTLIKFCYPFIANDCLFTELQRRMSLSHEHDELMNKKAHHMENLVWISKTPKNISKTRNESFAHVIVIVIVIVNVMGGRHGSIVIVHQQQQCIMLATSSKR